MIRVIAEADPDSREVYVRLDGSGPEFHDIVARLKLLPDRKFNPQTKYWIVPLSDQSLLELNRSFPRVETGPILSEYVAKREQRTEREIEVEKIKMLGDAELPEDFPFRHIKFFAHQRASIAALLKLGNSANFSQMGTGKTVCALSVAGYRLYKGEIKNVLVVCPKSVMGVWQLEIQKHGIAKLKDVVLLEGSMTNKVNLVKKHKIWSVCNYESIWRIINLFKENKEPVPQWDMVIADESSAMKNKSSKQTKGMMILAEGAKFKHCLDGTPISQCPLDIWPQSEFIQKGILGYHNFYSFQQDYSRVVRSMKKGNMTIPTRMEWVNLDKLQYKVDRFSVRYLKKECLDLPEQLYQTREVELSGDQKKGYEDIRDQFLLLLESGEKTTVPNLLAQLTRLQQVVGGFINTDEGKTHFFDSQAKLEALDEIIEQGITGDVKGVVWARFIPEIELISKLLNKKGIPFVTLTGDTKDRSDAIKEFQEGQPKVFVSQADTGSLGISLTRASLAVYYSNSFRYKSREQSESRLHREGQKNPVTYIELVTTMGVGPRGGKIKTIDNRIYEIINSKRNMADAITGDLIKKWLSKHSD